jgi:L-lactate dehydrogenase
MKISVIGTGRVGATTAFAIMLKGLAHELVLVGRDLSKAEGEARDLQHASAFIRPMKVHAGTIDATKNSDIVVVCVGAPWLDTSHRLTMATDNAAIFREIIQPLSRLSPDAILLVVTNPVDVMTHLALRLSRFSPNKVVGTGTLIDTGRFRSILADAWGINALDVRAYILGEHGDSQFPALSVASAGGVKFDEHDQLVASAAAQARVGGYEVWKHKGYTNFAVAIAAMLICEAISTDSRAVMPVSTLIDGWQGIKDVCLSVPVVMGRGGIVRTLPIDLDPDELEQMRESAGVLRKVLDEIG